MHPRQISVKQVNESTTKEQSVSSYEGSHEHSNERNSTIRPSPQRLESQLDQYSQYLKDPQEGTRNVSKFLKRKISDERESSCRQYTSPPKSVSPPSAFNISKYVPFTTVDNLELLKTQPIESFNLKQENYRKEFYIETKANSKKIFEQLHELTLNQIVKRINADPIIKEIPSHLQSNKEMWGQFIIRSKKVQKVICYFSDKIAEILEQEFSYNNKLVGDYLHLPHKDQHFSFVSKPPTKYKKQGALDKAKEKIQQLQKAVQQKKDQQMIDNKVKDQMLDKIKDMKALHYEQVAKENLNKPKKKKYNHPMAEQLEACMKRQNDLLAQIEENDQSFSTEVTKTEQQLQNLEILSSSVPNPGQAINNLLLNWGQEPIETKKHFDNYAGELWQSLAVFEKELRKEERGCELQLKHMEQIFLQRTRNIRQQASFRIQALETALIETKIKAQLETDRCNMRISEIESAFLNALKSDQLISNDLHQAQQLLEHQLDFTDRRTQENLLNCLKNLSKSVQSLNTDKNSLQTQVKDLDFENAKLQKQAPLQEQMLAQAYHNVSLYQKQLAEVCTFTSMSDDKYHLFSEPDRTLYNDLQDAICRFDFDRFSRINESNVNKFKYLSIETDKIGQTLKLFNVPDFFNRYKLFARDNEGLMTEAFKQMEKLGFFVYKEHDETQTPPTTISGRNITKIPTDPNLVLEKMGFKLQLQPGAAKIMSDMAKLLKNSVKNKSLDMAAEFDLKKAQDLARKFESSESVLRSEQRHQESREEKSPSLPQKPAVIHKIEKPLEKAKEFNQKDLKRTSIAETIITVEKTGKLGEKNQKVFKVKNDFEVDVKASCDTESLESEVGKNASSKKIQDQATQGLNSQLSNKNTSPNVLITSPSQYSKTNLINPKEKSSSRNLQVKSELSKTKNELHPQIKLEIIDGEDARDPIEKLIAEHHRQLIQETESLTERDLKFNTAQFEQLHREFQVTLNATIQTDDYMNMFQTSMFDDLFGLINQLIPKYSVTKKPQNQCAFSDCIVADINSKTGCLQGFSIRTKILKVLYQQDDLHLTEIKKVIKRVNYLNRILKTDTEEYNLVGLQPKQVTSTDSQADIQLAETVEKIVVTDELTRLFSEIKEHLIKLAAKNEPKRISYYNMMWGDLPISKLLLTNIVGMQQQEQQDSDVINSMLAIDYLSSVFSLVNKKLAVVMGDQQTSSTQLVQNHKGVTSDEASAERIAVYSSTNDQIKIKQKQSKFEKNNKITDQNLGSQQDGKLKILVSQDTFSSEDGASLVSPTSQYSKSSNFSHLKAKPRILTPQSLLENKQVQKIEIQQERHQVTQRLTQKLTQTDKVEEKLKIEEKVKTSGFKQVQTDPVQFESPEKVKSQFFGMIDQVLKNEINRTIDTMTDFVATVKEAQEMEQQFKSGKKIQSRNPVNLKEDSPEKTLSNINEAIQQDTENIAAHTNRFLNKNKSIGNPGIFSKKQLTQEDQDTQHTLPMLINGRLVESLNKESPKKYSGSLDHSYKNFQSGRGSTFYKDKHMLNNTQLGNIMARSNLQISIFREKYKSPDPQRPNYPKHLSHNNILNDLSVNLDNPARMQIQLNQLLQLNKTSTNGNGLNLASSKSTITQMLSNTHSGSLRHVSLMGEVPFKVSPAEQNSNQHQLAEMIASNHPSVKDILRKRNLKLDRLLQDSNLQL